MRTFLLIALLFLATPAFATFPVVAASALSSNNGATTSHTVNLPTGIGAGHLLLCEFAVAGYLAAAPTVTWPAGWTSYFEGTQTTTTVKERLNLAWRLADGAEGASITVTTSSAQRSAHNCRRITGAADPTTTPPEASTAAIGANATPDPGAVTPTGGNKDYLWIASVVYGVTLSPVCVPTISVYPSGYTNGVAQTSGGGSDEEARLGSAEKTANASSDDPGTFTMTSTDCSTMPWVAATTAVHPSIAAAAAIPTRRRSQ